MTPAEMREMAAQKIEILVRQHGMYGLVDAKSAAKSIRAIPIPDTTAADDALEKAREALFRCQYDMQVHRVFVTSREQAFSAEVYDAAISKAAEALAAIDATIWPDTFGNIEDKPQ